MNTQAAKLIKFSTLLNTALFFTPIANTTIIKSVMTKANKSGVKPARNKENKICQYS